MSLGRASTSRFLSRTNHRYHRQHQSFSARTAAFVCRLRVKNDHPPGASSRSSTSCALCFAGDVRFVGGRGKRRTPRMKTRATTTTTTISDSSDDDDVNDDAMVAMKPSLLGKLGQSMNVAGISLFLKLAVSDASLAIPHIDCESIQDIDWFKLKKAGFTAVIFDKDNTLTIPYAAEVYPPLRESMKECKQAFGNERVCVYSNSAGLIQYDPDGIEAAQLEKELGIRVARHKEKKPSGSGTELAEFLNSNSSEKEKNRKSTTKDEEENTTSPCEKFVFVGDRYLTDVVFGNKSGMFTIRVAPFDVSHESKAIAAARSIESYFLRRWRTKNKTKATPHALDEKRKDDEEESSVYLKTNAARSWREER